MRSLSDLTPARTDRAIFIGQTGSGKTTLARALLSTRQYVVVLDTKGQIRWPEYQLVRNNDDLPKLKPSKFPRILYIPSYEWTQNTAEHDRFFGWIYHRGNTTVYVDELSAVTQGDVYPFHLGASFMRGRELGIEVWAGSQRPMRIPQIAMSESEHVYVFRLRLPQDRLRVEQVASISQADIGALDKHQFLYARQSEDVQGPFRLTL